MSKHGRFEQVKQKKTGKKKTVLIVLGVVLAILVAAVIAAVCYYNAFLNKIPRAEHEEKVVSQEDIDAILNFERGDSVDATVAAAASTEATEATVVETTIATEPAVQTAEDITNILVIGDASRGGGEESHMADTMILVSVNKFTKTITLTSFLRDTYVKLPDFKDSSGTQHTCGRNKLTTCYALGYAWGGTADAMDMLDQCLYENFGIEVDFNVEVGFEGVEQIVNYFGGLEFDLTQEEADYLNADKNYVMYPVSAGPQVLDGLATLSYARMRKASGDNDSDIKRTSRQRVVLEKLIDKVRDADVAGLKRLMDDFMEYIVTDMTNSDITKCMVDIFPLVADLKLEQGTCPVETTYWGEGVEMDGYTSYVLKFDEGQNKKLMKAITEGVAAN